MTMLKKMGKTIGILLAVALLGAVIWLGTAFFGNPVSALLAKTATNRYIQEQYDHLDLEVRRFGYNFKTAGYYAYVVDASSPDTAFYINLDMLGNLEYDSFDTWVTGKMNTEQRVQEQYRVLVDSILESADFPYQSDILGGMLDFRQDREVGDDRDYNYAISTEELILDKEYSREEILSFGEQAGILTIYVQESTVTVERASEIMLDIKAMFDDAGVTFYRMDFVLQYTKPEDGSPWPEGDVRAELTYDEIQEEGLTGRIKASHDAIYRRFAEMDAEKGLIISDND